MKNDHIHDGFTVAAISLIAFVICVISHEGLGHGTVALISGANQIVLSYTYLSSDISTRWISLAGPVANLIEGAVAWVLLYRIGNRPGLMLLSYLIMAYNLLVASGYLVFSGIFNSGDIAVVFGELFQHVWIRIVVVLVGAALYWRCAVLCGEELRRFQQPCRDLLRVAYLAPLILNVCAAALNSLGVKYFLISALPATAAANAALLVMSNSNDFSTVKVHGIAIARSTNWVTAGVLVALLFVLTIGPGVALK